MHQRIDMEKQDVFCFRLIRVIASFSIVVLHTFSFFVTTYDCLNIQRILSFSVRNLQMYAVPCFVMVSGALLLNPDREISIRHIYSKYIKRIVIALLVFSLVFFLADFLISGQPLTFASALVWLRQVYQNSSWNHMWYLYMILAIYLLLPLYRIISKGAEEKEYRYGLLIYLIGLVILPTLDAVTGIKTGFYICVYTVYPFYFFLGFALSRKIVRIPGWIAGLFFMLGLVGIILLTVLQFHSNLEPAGKLTGNYSSIVVVIFSTGVFGLLSQIERTKDKQNFFFRLILILDHVSFGVYLIHMIGIKLFISFVRWNPYSLGVITGCLAVFAVSAAIYLLSSLLVYCGRKFAHAVRSSST